MYPAYMAVAVAQDEQAAQRSIHYAMEAEKIHAVMYGQAKQAVDSGKDASLGPVRVCTVCGHTVEGNTPETCPVCGAKSDKFLTFAQDSV